MELIILGCWAPYPAPGGACPGYLIKTSEGPFLLDCGNGVFSKLQQHINFRDLEGIIITHLHPDHHFDLFPIRHAIEGAQRDGSRKTKLKLFVPSQPKEAYQRIYDMKQAFEIIPIETMKAVEELGKGESVRLWQKGQTSIKFFPTKHPLLTYAVNFEEEKDNFSKIAYTADTGYKEELAEFFWEADYLLSEASLQEVHKEMTKLGHLTAGEAGILAKKSMAKNLILTHFWPEFDLIISKKESEETYGKQVFIAKEGDVFKL